MVNKKRVGMMVAVTLLIGVLLFCSVFFLVRRANREITQRSFDELTTATRQIAKDFVDTANADQTILSAMAELIAGHDERDNDAVLRIMKSFSLSETFVSTVALLRPDGTLLLTDGGLYRIGGDEFVVFSKADAAVCEARMQAVSSALAAQDYSISYGIAAQRMSAGLGDLVREADENMLKGKRRYYAEHDRRRPR